MGKVHVGTMGWSYKFWTDNFYPKGLPPDHYLSEYAKHFHTVEVDNTFYRMPNKDVVTNWRNQTPPDFVFSLKFPKRITHDKMLRDCGEITAAFLDRISPLDSKLGPMLLQFPYAFKPEHLSLLSEFLPTLPRSNRFVVEVRNRKLLDEKLYSILTDNHVAFAIVEQPFMPLTETITADFVYIRIEGDRRKVNGTLGKVEIDRTDQIKQWAARITKLMEGSAEVFVYFSKYYSGHPPTDARQLLQLL